MARSAVYQRLREAMLAIEEERELHGIATSHRGPVAVIEAVAHELAHQLDAGRNFEWRIAKGNMEGNESNEHEMSTLRIEVAALRQLGVRVSLRRLWYDANWRLVRPRLTRWRQVLDAREWRCVAAFVKIVDRKRRDLDQIEEADSRAIQAMLSRAKSDDEYREMIRMIARRSRRREDKTR